MALFHFPVFFFDACLARTDFCIYLYPVSITLDYMHHISLPYFRELFSSCPSIGLGDDFFIMDIHLGEPHQPLAHPCRFDGYMLIYCISGHVRLNVNLNEYDLRENMVFFNLPGNLIRVNELVDTKQEDLHYVCLAMSKDFVGELKIDMNKLFTEGMSLLDNPGMEMTASEQDVATKYIELIGKVLSSDMTFKKESICTIMASVFYMLAGIWSRKQESQNVVPQTTSRSRMIFDQFIKLVSEYHTKYRNVGFYADKLCLTPKYLSKLIKDVSGRSAPDWIDSYVILEAKNLLKYSNVAIKEIVYTLNFPNQSVFYKFFKSRTGMTPSDYRSA